MTEHEITTKRLIDLSRMSYERGIYTYSDFLTLAEQSDLITAAKSKELYTPGYSVYGGYEGAERIMVSFGNKEELGYEQPWPISCIRISPLNHKFADELTHRDFLGSLMNLGFERQLLGDILLTRDDNNGYKQNINAYLFAKEHIAETICRELTRIKHTTVTCNIVDNMDEIPSPRLSEESLQIKSERIDLIIAHLYKLSRSQASELFLAKKVFVNGRLMENESHTLNSGDLISVRGHGRFLYNGAGGTTRKGNLIAKVSRYI